MPFTNNLCLRHGLRSMRGNFLCLLFVLAFSISIVPSAHAQSASVSGQVIDASGAVVPNVQITLTNTATNTSLRSKTNNVGIYNFPFVKPGKYSLRGEHTGFESYIENNITVSTAQALEVDFRVKVGGGSQAITVSGSGAQINTTDASVSTVIDREFVENIPLNGRSFQSLLTAVPGVAIVPTYAAPGQSGEITVNGQRTESNYFTVDGVSASTGVQPTNSAPGYGAGYSGSVAAETALGTTQSMVSIDALQEFRATTSTYSAESGRTPGGQFSFQTRSGTNDWHGSAFDYFRNGALDANNYFNKFNTPYTARQAERQNDFGGTLGGPIRIPGLYNGKDRTFFFFSYEGLRLQLPYAATLNQVPSLSLRASAPTELKPVFNAFPLPNGADLGNGIAYYTGGYSSPGSIDSSSIRIDHHFGDKFQVFGRFSDVPSSVQSRATGGFSDMAVVNGISTNTKSLTLGATNAIASSLANDLRFNFTWNQGKTTATTDNYGGATPLPSNFLSGVPGYQEGNSYYFLMLYGSFFPSLGLTPLSNDQHQLNIVETMNAALGRHNLKWGIDYRRLLNSGVIPADQQVWLYSSESDILSNQSQVTAYLGPSRIAPVYTNFSAFIQDEWKATPRLSLSLGLRWELNPAPKDANGNNPYTVTSTDVATLQVAPKNTPLWQTTYNNFAPRFGLAYQLHQQPGHETVLRAGGGIFYDTANAVGTSQAYQGQGLTSAGTFNNVKFPLTQQQLDSIPAPSASGPYENTVFGSDPYLKLPYSWQWNLALEQALGTDQTLTLSYVGSAGRRLLWRAYDFPSNNPNFDPNGNDQLILITNGSMSNYDALQVQFQRKMSHGLQALASYTWSHSLDDTTSAFHPLEQLYADSDNDIRHNFQLSLTYNVPGTYSNRVVGAVLRDWSVAARITSRSSSPVDVLGAETYLHGSGQEIYYQPDRVPGEPLYLYGSNYPGGRVINYKAYKMPVDSDGNPIQGSAGRNSARGFGATQADLSINREFPIMEKVRLQFRAEAFNVFNQAIMGAVYGDLNYGEGIFGYAYATQNNSYYGLSSLYQVGGPRSLQLALKVHF